ncbi:MAG: VWA domain-containing protein [Anaerolineae bacterium]
MRSAVGHAALMLGITCLGVSAAAASDSIEGSGDRRDGLSQTSSAVTAYVHVETVGRFNTPYEAGQHYNEPLAIFAEDQTLGRREVHVVEGAGRRIVGLSGQPGAPGLFGSPGLAFTLGDTPIRHLASAAVDPRPVTPGPSEPPGSPVDGVRAWLVDDTTHQVIGVDEYGRAFVTLGVEGEPGADDAHFDSPSGIAVDGAGRVFVSDTGNDRIQVFTSEGALLGSIGTPWAPGTPGVPGSFSRPRDLELTPDGSLWVADSGNARVVLIDPVDVAGARQQMELGVGLLAEPVGIAAKGSFVYVADAGACNVKIIYRGSGDVQATLGSAGSCRDWPAGPPTDVSPLETSVYVAYPEADAVGHYQLLERGGWSNTRVQPASPYIPVEGSHNEPVQASRLAGDGLLVLEKAGHRLLRVEPDGYVSWSFGSAGAPAGGDSGLRAPSDFAIDAAGDVIVADTGNDRLVRIGADGRFSGVILAGELAGRALSGPTGVDVADDGRVAIADTGNDRVLIHQPATGSIELLTTVDGIAVDSPGDVAFTSDGLVVADTGNHRVVAVRSDLTTLWTAGAAGSPGDSFDLLDSPGQVAVGDDGRVAVADTGNDRVQVFDTTGRYLTTLGGLPGPGGGAFREPWGVSFWNDGLLAVADAAQHQVQVFAPAVEPHVTDWRPENVNGHGDRHIIGTSALESWGDALWTSSVRLGRDGPQTEMMRFAGGTWRRAAEMDLDRRLVSDMVMWQEQLWLAVTGVEAGRSAAGGLLTARTSLGVHDVDDISRAVEPGGGGVVLHATDSGLYVGINSGGATPEGQLWHTASGADGSWARLAAAGEIGSSASSVTAVAIMSDTLYAGTCAPGPGEIWRSEGGAAWARVPLPEAEDGADADADGADPDRADPDGADADADGADPDGADAEDADADDAAHSVCLSSAQVFGDHMYLSTGRRTESQLAPTGATGSDGGRVWRCALCDGTDWEEATPVDLDPVDGGWSALRLLDSDPFHFMYLAAGSKSGVAVFRTLDGGAWEPATVDGWGDVQNTDVYGPSSLAEHHGRLYVGSLNFGHGTEIWSTSARPTRGGSVEPPVVPTPRPWTDPPTGRADYVVAAKWPRSDVASPDAVGDIVDSALAADGTMYLADATNGRIVVVGPAGDRGAPVYPGGGAGRAVGRLGALALDESRGRLYLADTASSRVVVTDLSGQVLGVWRDVHAAALHVAGDGTVWVADRAETAIRQLDSGGIELQRFGEYGSGPIPFGRLSDLHVVSDTEVYVLDRTEVSSRSGSHTKWTVHRLRRSGPDWLLDGQYDLRGQRCAGGTGSYDQPLAELPDRMAGLPDGSILVARCTLTDMRRGADLPETYPSEDLVSVRLRTVGPAGTDFAAFATRDLTPQAYDDGWLGVARFSDEFVTAEVFQRLARVAPASIGQGQAVGLEDPAMMSLTTGGDLVVATELGGGTWTIGGEPLAALPTSFYPSRTSLCFVDPRTVRPAAEPGTAMGLCTELVGYNPRAPERSTIPKEYVRAFKARIVARRRCVREDGKDICKVSDYLEPIWVSSLPHAPRWLFHRLHEQQVQNAAVDYDPVADRYCVLQNYASASHEVSTHVVVLDADGYGNRAYLELPDDSRHAVWEDLDVGPDGRVYVLESLTDRVFVYAPDLQLEAVIQPPFNTWQVAGGPADDVFYLDVYGTVVRTALDGEVLARFDGRPHAGVSATSLTDLEVDLQGWVYTSDRDADQITVFRPVKSESSARDPRDCGFVAEKVAAPRHVLLGDPVGVLLQIYGSCGYEEKPTDLVVAVNTHGLSWYGPPRQPNSLPPPNPNGVASDVARRIVAGVDFSRHRVGVLAFSGSHNIESPLTTDTRQLANALASPYAGRSDPRLYPALRGALDVFERGGTRRRVLVIIDPPDADQLAVEAAHRLRAELDVHIVTVNGLAPLVADSDLSDDIPVHPVEPGSARAVHPFLLETDRPDVAARDIEITDQLPANMEFVPGSATASGTWDAGTRTITWHVAKMADFERPAVGFQVRPLDIGLWPTNVEAHARLTDGWGEPHELTFPIPEVMVYDELPTATPTATATGTASPTMTPTPTATPSPTNTPRPTATNTPRPPKPLYLPVLLRTPACVPGSRNADVALVVDTSISMSDTTGPGGETKLAAAKDASLVFFELLVPGLDQAALIQFNDTAEVVVGLTGDIDELLRGLGRLKQASGTRIDRALDVAVAELFGPARREGNNPVLILLTDGRPSGVAPADVRASGQHARDAGVIVFTIGLGDDVDAGLLADLATTPTHAFLAPRTEQLQGIYERIVYALPCRPAWP